MARILIVDTQTELRHQLVRLLEQAGHRATSVATISEATTLLAEHVPDLLATNVVLTDGSSTNLAKQAEAAGARVLMIKYGALSVPGGRVVVSWIITGDQSPRLEINWQEEGGPKIDGLDASGFGTELIERGIRFELARG